MNDNARRNFDDLTGKTLDEAAQTYLLGVLQVDVPEDLRDLWESSFNDPEEQREAEAAIERLRDSDREALLALAMQATVYSRPETEPLFTESIDQAGQSMFVAEIAMVMMAAALLLREWHAKGRSKESRKKTTIEPGRITIEEWHVEFQRDGTLADAITKLGLGKGS
jgi:hypothetical protein